MSWGIVAGVGGSLVGSLFASDAAGEASDAQVASAQESNALQKYQYDTTRADNMPQLEARNNALAQYQARLPALTQQYTGANLTSDPGYQFGLRQGQNALQNSALNRGGLYSGAQSKAMQQFGTDYAGTKFNEAFNRNQASNNFEANQYQSLIGAGQSGVNQISAAGANYANQAGANITGAGNARAAGYIGSANAFNNGISQGINGYQNNQLMQMYQNRNYLNNAANNNAGGNLGGW